MPNNFKYKLIELNTDRQSTISPQLYPPSRKAELPITEQSTEILAAFSLAPPSRKAELPITEQSTEILAAFSFAPAIKALHPDSEQQVITFGKKTLFSLLLGLDFLDNILEITHVNFLGITTIISFFTCILLPGFLLSLILRIRKISLWENFLIIVGLGIAFLEFGGLLLNILFPLFGVNDPLAFQNLIIGFDIYVFLLFIFAWLRTKPSIILKLGQSNLTVEKGNTSRTRPGQFVRPGFIDSNNREINDVDTVTSIPIFRSSKRKLGKVLYILPVFFPVLAALGAIVLNNGGSNILTLILLGTIGCYCLLLMLFRDKVSDNIYPYAIFFIGLACLFTTSLRSWYITGHDIQREFYVFQLTNTHHIWNMASYQDAYNACLSITILPTILSNFLLLQDISIFKVVFQILFAFTPVLLFFIMRNYTSAVFAFLCAFFFISFPTFFNDMPMINRQEIGFYFFGLALYMMLIPSLNLTMRKTLFVIFATSVFASHYSTNFILLALITFVYVSTLIISLPLIKKVFAIIISKPFAKAKNTFSNKTFLSLPIILLLFIMTFVWNMSFTNSASHTESVIVELINGIFVHSNDRSNDISYNIFSPFIKVDPNKELQSYIQSVLQIEEKAHAEKTDNSPFYSKLITDKYPTYALHQEQLPPTPLGNLLSSFNISVFDVQSELRSISASFMQIFVFIGLLAFFLLRIKKPLDLQYLLLCIGSLFLLGLIVVLPNLSLEYGVLRMFQQLLFLLSLPIVLGLNLVLSFLKEQRRILLIGIIAITFFLNLTGFISHLTGNYYPQMTLDNAGLYYDYYYVHKSDVVAIFWLSNNNVKHDPIEADKSGSNKLFPFGNITAIEEVVPPLILRKAYVFLNVSTHIFVTINQNTYIYSTPQNFLKQNKNLIYSNGTDNIYK